MGGDGTYTLMCLHLLNAVVNKFLFYVSLSLSPSLHVFDIDVAVAVVFVVLLLFIYIPTEIVECVS